jgi:hypothetical protein
MKVKIKLRKGIQAGPGIEVANADANTIISAIPGGGSALTQPEFDAMLANAWTLIATEISAGALNTAVYDVSTFGAQDYIDSTYTPEVVEICGLGSVTLLTS